MKLKSDTQERYSPDVRTHDPQEKMYCGVCGDVMDASFEANGPTGSIEAMAGHKHLHDCYTCRNTGKGWHVQVIALRNEKRNTASTLVEALLEEEIGIVLETREATKEVTAFHVHGRT